MQVAPIFVTMKKILLLLLLIPATLFAQENISIGTKHHIQSERLNEEREYWVYLPPKYDNKQYGKADYPVIYLLDGEQNFSLLVGIHQAFTRGLYNTMPESIIVGIVNTDRTRDFTPSNASVMKGGKEAFTQSGGAENFTLFLQDELMPQIEKEYRTNGYNILIGHSFGGLFAINTLVHHTELFNAYIALDPSLWWDNQKLYKEATAIWANKDFKQRSLYVAMARKETKAKEKKEHGNTIEEFCKKLLPRSQKGNLNAMWKYYKEEDHGSILTPGIFDALRNLFKGYTLPVKEIAQQPELIESHLDALAKRLGHRFIADEVTIDRIGKHAASVGETENARQILMYNLRNYPDSPNAKRSLDEISKKQN